MAHSRWEVMVTAPNNSLQADKGKRARSFVLGVGGLRVC